MASPQEARVPDIGGFDDVPVIEVLVAAGDTVEKDQSLITLESDKATMEVPAPFAGTVREVKVKVGDTLSEGGVVALIEPADDDTGDAGDAGDSKPAADKASPGKAPAADAAPAAAKEHPEPEAPSSAASAAETGTQVEPVVVPEGTDNIARASIDHQAGVTPADDAAPPRRFDADAVL